MHSTASQGCAHAFVAAMVKRQWSNVNKSASEAKDLLLWRQGLTATRVHGDEGLPLKRCVATR
eukprot:276616-Chlamydomonas_euryale.AAC.1